jgi:hypothetical protein
VDNYVSFGSQMAISLLVDFKMINLLKEPLKLKKRKLNIKGNSKISRKMDKDN